VTAPESLDYFAQKQNVQVTGYPVRPDLHTWQHQAALEVFGLSADLLTLLVFGGSKGARSINRALLAALPQLLAEMQVIHVSGELDWPEVETFRVGLVDRLDSSLPLDQRLEMASRYHAYPYLHEEMGAALAAADLVVSRAGAATLGEFPLFGIPAILVPYPHAWRYQVVNAQFLTQRGAALLLEDRDLPEKLLPTVLGLVRDRSRREAMRQAMRSLARPDAARSIAHIIRDLAARRQERM
jgi:UDP-N-acetylglucosamine--N-acetylmuramyl-(pentapeptide) pyrophosphoryl-undecaprenol N-acetylglucosamine transferase